VDMKTNETEQVLPLLYENPYNRITVAGSLIRETETHYVVNEYGTICWYSKKYYRFVGEVDLVG